MVSGRQLYTQIGAMLSAAGIPESQAKARVLIAHQLDIGLGDVFIYPQIDSQTQARIMAMAQQCVSGMPVEYITGRAYFRRAVLEVSESVLIPRAETELVAERAIELIAQNAYTTVLDLCTGSGCIAISLATETQASVEACDISKEALRIAHRNAKANASRIQFFNSDMFGSVLRTYDIIISNPPYISRDEYAQLDKSVRMHEPRLALIAGDGLDFYRIIAAKALQHINTGGALVLEIGAQQAADVMNLLKDGGFGCVSIGQDYSGRDRIVTAWK